MLESLVKGNGNIHELNVEGAFLEQRPYRPRELYEALKATPLYDAERGQWNHSMSEGQRIENTDRTAFAQLLGVLVEAQFNPQATRANYETFKRTRLHYADLGQCNLYMTEKQELGDTDRSADAQLVRLLVEAELNPQDAREGHDALKRTPLYDAEHGQWNWFMNERQELKNSYRFAHTQLLGVLLEAELNPQDALTSYEALKQTCLYDADLGQWNNLMNERQELYTSRRFADAQLVGLLVEAQFNPQAAREGYESLKQTPLYDSERRQWNRCMTEGQELAIAYRFADAQLLAILVEAKLLSTLPRPITRTIPPLPLIKEF